RREPRVGIARRALSLGLSACLLVGPAGGALAGPLLPEQFSNPPARLLASDIVAFQTWFVSYLNGAHPDSLARFSARRRDLAEFLKSESGLSQEDRRRLGAQLDDLQAAIAQAAAAHGNKAMLRRLAARLEEGGGARTVQGALSNMGSGRVSPGQAYDNSGAGPRGLPVAAPAPGRKPQVSYTPQRRGFAAPIGDLQREFAQSRKNNLARLLDLARATFQDHGSDLAAYLRRADAIYRDWLDQKGFSDRVPYQHLDYFREDHPQVANVLEAMENHRVFIARWLRRGDIPPGLELFAWELGLKPQGGRKYFFETHDVNGERFWGLVSQSDNGDSRFEGVNAKRTRSLIVVVDAARKRQIESLLDYGQSRGLRPVRVRTTTFDLGSRQRVREDMTDVARQLTVTRLYEGGRLVRSYSQRGNRREIDDMINSLRSVVSADGAVRITSLLPPDQRPFREQTGMLDARGRLHIKETVLNSGVRIDNINARVSLIVGADRKPLAYEININDLVNENDAAKRALLID
ncbi:MAG: hypothetical protein KGK30_08285, partial [Elusimicrobia bacterium]|nr:hypothetical protein [Elusimicrobiota bacterium]